MEIISLIDNKKDIALKAIGIDTKIFKVSNSNQGLN